MTASAAGVHETDVAIVGAGPVGLFAVFECGMHEMRCHVIDALALAGGQCMALYPEKPIYDIPGYPRISGQELTEKLLEQAAPFKPTYHLDQQVTKLDEVEGGFRLTTATGTTVESKVVVIAAGVGAFGPNRPPIDGLAAYEASGAVQYLVRRREDLRGKKVVIAGGGDSAVDWALSLADVASRLSVVHRRDKFRAAPDSAAKLKALADAGKIDLVVPYQLAGLEGEGGRLSNVVVAALDGKQKRVTADVLLPFFGLAQDLGPIADWGLALERKQIAVDPATCATNRRGIFAIGDIVRYPGKQNLILTGFAEAAVAARAAYDIVHPGRALHFEYSTTKGVPSR